MSDSGLSVCSELDLHLSADSDEEAVEEDSIKEQQSEAASEQNEVGDAQITEAKTVEKEATGNKMNITVQTRAGEVLRFPMEPDMKLGRLMDNFVKVKPSSKEHRFFFEGRRIARDDTAKGLGIAPEDIIKVFTCTCSLCKVKY